MEPQLVKNLEAELEKRDPDVDGKFAVMRKEDGQYLWASTEEGVWRSRKGTVKRSLNRYTGIIDEAEKVLGKCTVIGEGVIRGKVFHEINGILNRHSHAEGVVICVHDVLIDGEDKTFEERWKDVEKLRGIEGVEIIEILDIVTIGKGLKKWTKHASKLKWEGLVLKRITGKYQEGKRCSDMMKLLLPVKFEATCIGIVEGLGEMEGMVGSLELEYNGIRFTAGGMSRELRQDFMTVPPIGEKFDVVCKEMLKSGKPREPRLCIS
jgi:ATP-dependent DNA ligase